MSISDATDADFYRSLGEHAGMPFVRLGIDEAAAGGDSVSSVDPAAARMLSEAVCRHFGVIAIARAQRTLTVATASVGDDLGLQAAGALSGLEVRAVIATKDDIERALTAIFGDGELHPSAPAASTVGESVEAGEGFVATPTHPKLRIGEALMVRGALTEEQVDAALEQQRRRGGRIGEILLHNVWVDETTLTDVLAEQMALPVVDLSELDPDPQALNQLPEPLMRELRCIPIAVDENTLYLAVSEDLGDIGLARLAEYTTLEIRRFLATPTAIDDMLQRLFRNAYIETATYDMVQRFPEDSANRVLTPAQRAVFAVALILIAIAVAVFPITALIVVLGFASVFYAAVSLYKVYLVYQALGHEYELDIGADEVADMDERTLPVYTILVPLFKEAAVIPRLAAGIAALDYPRHLLDVRLLCEEEDDETIEAVRALDLPPHFHLVIVPESHPKTKPKACNYGLLHAEGKYVVIYDAEDQPDPDQLKRVVLAFQKAAPSVTCVQAKLNYFNRDQNLLTRWFAIEYSLWFDLILPGLDAQNVPIPLGGTSNHFLTARLVELGAWDPYNVTEDADLGIRLHKAGYQTAIIDSTTLEEANSEVNNWIRQRSRWIKGYIQTWLVHMRHPVRLFRELGPKSFFSFNMIVGGTFIFLLNPIFWLLTTLFALTQAGLIAKLFPGVIFYASSFLLFLGNFIFIYLNVAGAVQRRYFSLVRAALVSPFYWGLMSLAAWKGFIQLFTNPFYWEKTEHGLDAGHGPGGSAG
jgi:cellulose synthase/poly-beta-1,6-N-acetylglucosamine synthase-like glycosyltransferase